MNFHYEYYTSSRRQIDYYSSSPEQLEEKTKVSVEKWKSLIGFF